jgi:hypothetical protein
MTNKFWLVALIIGTTIIFLGCAERPSINQVNGNDKTDEPKAEVGEDTWLDTLLLSASFSLERGFRDASFIHDVEDIAEIYSNGYEVEKNPSEAQLWNAISAAALNNLAESANLGDLESQYQLAEYYWGSSERMPNSRRNNAKRAIHWYTKAAEQGYIPAMSDLWFIYGLAREHYRYFGSAVEYEEGTQLAYLDYFDSEYWKTIPINKPLSEYWDKNYTAALDKLRNDAVAGCEDSRLKFFSLYYSEAIYLSDDDSLLAESWRGLYFDKLK